MRLFFIAKFWIPLAFVTTLLCGLIYLSVQQNFRMSANDPQIQIAEDSAIKLASGQKPESLVSSDTVDLAKSLAPFVIVYDTSGNVVTSSAALNGSVPNLPNGVLQMAKNLGENRLTWQPRDDVREAVVIVPFVKGYVLAGRSLREVEIRERMLGVYVGAAWATLLVGSLLLISFFAVISPYSRKK